MASHRKTNAPTLLSLSKRQWIRIVAIAAAIVMVVAAGIQAVPTLMIAKQGQIIFKQAGALRAEDLDDLIAQAKALDVSAAAQDSAASAE